MKISRFSANKSMYRRIGGVGYRYGYNSRLYQNRMFSIKPLGHAL